MQRIKISDIGGFTIKYINGFSDVTQTADGIISSYREALEKLTHLPVSERRLYSFKLGTDKDYGI